MWKSGIYKEKPGSFCKEDWGKQTEDYVTGITSRNSFHVILVALKAEGKKVASQEKEAKKKSRAQKRQEDGDEADSEDGIDPRANPPASEP